MNYRNIGKTVFLFGVAALASFFAWQIALAVWTDPATSAPGGNVAEPLNTTPGDQSKSGRLNIGAGLNYWIAKSGDSFALVNNDEAAKFVIGQDGNVGIGTTSTAYKLQVKDASDIYSYVAGNPTVGTNYGSGASIELYNGATGRMTFTNGFGSGFVFAGGNVGIGTTAPRNELEVGNTASNQTIRIGGIYRGAGSGFTGTGQETDRHQIVFSSWRDAQPDTVGAKIAGINLTNYVTPNWDLVQKTDLAFYTLNTTPASSDATTEKMRLTAEGNVGIGTTNPGATLDVNGTVKISGGTPGAGKVLTSDADGLASWQTAGGGIDGSGTASYVGKFTDGNTLGNSLIYDNGTNIGIGSTSPAAKLDIAGTVKISGGSPGSGKVLTSDASGLASWTTPASGTITGSGSSNYVPKFTSSSAIGNSKIYDNGSSVGIGTASPQATLDVRGSLGVYGTFGATGISYLQGGASVTGTVTASSSVTATAFYYSSDASLKKNVSPIMDSLEKIGKLDGVYFNWIDSDNPSMGLIAQNVEQIFPQAVSANPQTGLKTVDYGKMVAPLIEAVKEQQKEIEALKKEVEGLKSQLAPKN